jgi:RNA polymerase sigma factor (sigma-70 family)
MKSTATPILSTVTTEPIDSDACLVLAAKAGDQEAFAELSKRHSKRLFQSILRITRNREDAEDALQTAYLNAYLHIGSFDGRSSFSSWLTRICINAGLGILRQRRNRPQISLECNISQNGGAMDEPLDQSIDIERTVIERQHKQILYRSIARLTPSLRQVLMMQCSLDCSNHELAYRTGLTIAAVKSRTLRARNQLKQRNGFVRNLTSRLNPEYTSVDGGQNKGA